jgi:DNA primase catalytic subunit
MKGVFEKKRYYDWLFPIVAPTLVKLVTQNGKHPLQNVVIIPRWTSKEGETIMGKWQPFYSCEELIKFGQDKKPDSFQLGGVFHSVPTPEVRQLNKNGITTAMGPVVLDIDINDYNRDGVCDCGDAHKMCNTCYLTLLQPAQRCLDYLLKQVYGFKKVFHVFSGKRGMHTWILDDRVWEWTREQREVFLKSISVDSITIKKDKTVQTAFFKRPAFDIDPHYPVFDRAVTEDQTHLKKLPLMMHQDTLNISFLFPDVDSGMNFSMDHHCMKPNDVSPDVMKLFTEKLNEIVLL